MKYIILTGGDTGANNLGDQWILQRAKIFYKKYLGKYKIIIMLDGDISHYSDGFKYINNTKEEIEKLSIKVEDIQLLHYYGGGYLNEYWYDWRIWQVHYFLEKGLPCQKIVFTGLGIGPFIDSKKIQDLKNISSQVYLFGVRDKNYLNVLENTTFSFDDSVSLINPFYVMKKKSFLNRIIKRKKIKVAINIRPGSAGDYVGIDSKEYETFLKKLKELESINSNKYLFSYFPMMENSWLSETNNFIKLAKSVSFYNVEIIKRAENYKQLIRTMKNFDLIITTSYHAALSGIYAGVPVLGVYNSEYYEYKFRGINDPINSSYFEFIKINSLTSKKLFEICERKHDYKEKKLLFDKLKELKKVNLTFWKKLKRII